MIQGSEEAVLWLQLSEPLTVGMFGDLRGEKKKKESKHREKEESHAPKTWLRTNVKLICIY